MDLSKESKKRISLDMKTLSSFEYDLFTTRNGKYLASPSYFSINNIISSIQ